jgi:hypothetical protein
MKKIGEHLAWRHLEVDPPDRLNAAGVNLAQAMDLYRGRAIADGGAKFCGHCLLLKVGTGRAPRAGA